MICYSLQLCHVTRVCLPSQSAPAKNNQENIAHKPLRTWWISLPCLIIIQSCYFDCKINKPFACSRCVSCSVHFISTHYVRKGSYTFFLPRNQRGRKIRSHIFTVHVTRVTSIILVGFVRQTNIPTLKCKYFSQSTKNHGKHEHIEHNMGYIMFWHRKLVVLMSYIDIILLDAWWPPFFFWYISSFTESLFTDQKQKILNVGSQEKRDFSTTAPSKTLTIVTIRCSHKKGFWNKVPII